MLTLQFIYRLKQIIIFNILKQSLTKYVHLTIHPTFNLKNVKTNVGHNKYCICDLHSTWYMYRNTSVHQFHIIVGITVVLNPFINVRLHDTPPPSPPPLV